MKIGIIISFFDFRNDVRELVRTFQKNGHEVVVFYKDEEKKKILNHSMHGVEYRIIQENNRTLRNRFWEYIFLFFKKLPQSRTNYFLMELFKISNAPKKSTFNLSKLAYWVQKIGINFFSFDAFLDKLSPSKNTNLEGIDKFIGFTEFPCNYLAARLIEEKIDFEVYVYSWDHPCKHTRFSKRFRYMVWSEGIKNDLIELQYIQADKIRIIGSTQFGYIHDYINNHRKNTSPYSFPYMYYCCAIGIKDLVPEEVAIIEKLAQSIFIIQPAWKLVVRPYPVLNAWDLYDPLRRLDNIIFDDQYRSRDLSVQHDQLMQKLHKMDCAKAVIHTGSTIGIEAVFLRGPSFLVDFGYRSKKGLSVYNFIHQYQNDKYISAISGEHLITGLEAFEALLAKEFGVEPSHNEKVAKNFPLKRLTAVADEMLAAN